MEPVMIEVPVRLVTERLIVRRPLPGDGAVLNAAVCESLPALQPWMPWAQAAPTLLESEAVCRRLHAQFELRQDLTMFVFERGPDEAEGELLGGTGLHRMDWTLRRFEIGYWRRSGRGHRGLLTEAVRAVSRMVFDRLDARRVEICMDDRNTASWRLAERAGFTLEGVLRQQALDVQGRPRDTRVYARVRGVEEPVAESPTDQS